jgi:tetratricopeptide (TPR) repeat protein
MLDIRDLEEAWKKYNRKRKRPIYIGFFSMLLLAVGIGVTQYKHINSNFSIGNLINTTDVNKTKDVEVKGDNKVDNKVDILFLLNSKFNQLESQHNNVEGHRKSTHVNAKTSDLPIDEDDLFTETDISKPVIKQKPISIIKVANSNAYKDVEKRFRRSHNINDSIFLATMYYKKRNYQKAIYWSMQTNKLDNNIEESWLTFAKSKVKLGRKNEAIRVLKAYIKRSNSYEAKKLLKKLEN